FKSGNVGRCRDREMFFSLAFLSDFIIDYILVLYFSVAFFISFIFKFFSLGFFGGGVECVLKWFLCFGFLEPI
ncbi:hypothetical protein, partial [Helicobacter pylori]|uniref:hypothetical protein n=1 Tax=Helicobacter pylori TaxID=210 RepID=UPI001E520D8A